MCCTSVNMKRVMVNFTDEQWDLLKKFKGILGNSDSQIIRTIVIAWLSEKTYLKDQMDLTKMGFEETEERT